MSNLLDLLVAGLATGAIYALVAVGFTLLWQTSQTINFAQGEFVMLPAFLMLAVMHAGAPFWLAIILGILLSLLLLGLGFKLLLVDPMLRHGVLPGLPAGGGGGAAVPRLRRRLPALRLQRRQVGPGRRRRPVPRLPRAGKT